jgi:hypothetical protein
MSEFAPKENSVSIRNPATANFLIDSRDRYGFAGGYQNQQYISSGVAFQSSILVSQPPGQTSCDFLINKPNSLLNGYFTRLAVQEVYLDFCLDNISAYNNNNKFIVQNPGTSAFASATLPDGNYTTAQAINQTAALLNASTIKQGFSTFVSTSVGSIGTSNANYSIYFSQSTSGAAFSYFVSTTNLAIQLNAPYNVSTPNVAIDCAKLLPSAYYDFICPQATANQDIKDGSTSLTDRNILYRWYLGWDGPGPTDQYGYPIFQGQQPFISRRAIPFPKQIRWSANQPIGQMAFQVIDDSGNIANPNSAGQNTEVGEFEWAMTLLVSEN